MRELNAPREQCLLSANLPPIWRGCWLLMGLDEKGMHQWLKAHRPELIERELKVLTRPSRNQTG